jgi:hypothetical protein
VSLKYVCTQPGVRVFIGIDTPEGIFDRLESLFAMFSNQIISLLQFFRLSLSKNLCSFAGKSKSNFMSL